MPRAPRPTGRRERTCRLHRCWGNRRQRGGVRRCSLRGSAARHSEVDPASSSLHEDSARCTMARRSSRKRTPILTTDGQDMPPHKLTIAIDGPAGAGKSTVASRLAARSATASPTSSPRTRCTASRTSESLQRKGAEEKRRRGKRSIRWNTRTLYVSFPRGSLISDSRIGNPDSAADVSRNWTAKTTH